MPEQPDDDRVPPLKVMRKRLNGVYRADTGFSGPTRRYVLIVALLVGLASVPTLAAITAGSSEIADGGTDTMDIPFLPPASPGPIQSPPNARVGASPYALPPGAGEAIARAGRLLGEAGRRHPTTKIKRPSIPYAGKHSTPERDAARPKASPRPGRSPSMVAFPPLPGLPALPHLPTVSGRSAPRKHHDADPPADLPTDPPADAPTDPPADIVDPAQLARSAFPDMSDEDHCSHHHRRRSVVPERPHNIRAASILERSYAQGSLNMRHPRTDDNRADGSYRGSHRAGSRHHTDDLQAELRSSRVGRHHAEPSEDLTGRW
ncbi:hypothetical protein [Actinoplanes subtropicus]|uniref:hypothetical protein n=1 Tax=Actinoplanes subtropicus TaxID=543632 RepID=UPI0004C2EB16|nr:hypothetical protein [Actinoplanes subtropicus]